MFLRIAARTERPVAQQHAACSRVSCCSPPSSGGKDEISQLMETIELASVGESPQKTYFRKVTNLCGTEEGAGERALVAYGKEPGHGIGRSVGVHGASLFRAQQPTIHCKEVFGGDQLF